MDEPVCNEHNIQSALMWDFVKWSNRSSPILFSIKSTNIEPKEHHCYFQLKAEHVQITLKRLETHLKYCEDLDTHYLQAKVARLHSDLSIFQLYPLMDYHQCNMCFWSGKCMSCFWSGKCMSCLWSGKCISCFWSGKCIPCFWSGKNACRVSDQVNAYRVSDQVNAYRVSDQVNACRVSDQVNACRVSDQVNAGRVSDQVNACLFTDQINACLFSDQLNAGRVCDQVNTYRVYIAKCVLMVLQQGTDMSSWLIQLLQLAMRQASSDCHEIHPCTFVLTSMSIWRMTSVCTHWFCLCLLLVLQVRELHKQGDNCTSPWHCLTRDINGDYKCQAIIS